MGVVVGAWLTIQLESLVVLDFEILQFCGEVSERRLNCLQNTHTHTAAITETE